MTDERRIPDAVLQKLAVLQTATRVMPALEEEIRFLEQRLRNGDMAAAYLGLRSTAEAMLRHAARAESVKVNGDGVLRDLKQALEPVKKLSQDFWSHMRNVQEFGNRHVHSQADDVYHQAGLRPAHDPWSDVELCLGHLAAMAKEFVEQWPPPTPVIGPALDEEPSSDEPPLPGAATKLDIDVEALGNLTSKHAAESPAARAALQRVTGKSRAGISRRLNAAHGSRKVRNLFPELFGHVLHCVPNEVIDEPTLDYETIGNLTFTEAQALDLVDDIARLANVSEATVKRRMRDMNGNAVVRRQFSWYDAATIGELTVRTARDYGLAPVLARAFHKRRSTVIDELAGAAGQTKLRSLYPELDA